MTRTYLVSQQQVGAPGGVAPLDGAGDVPADNLPAATAAIAGIVELATTLEATTGTDTARAVTPAGLKAAINALVAGAPGALDTLKEIADQLAADESAASALMTLVTAIRNLTDTTHNSALTATFARRVPAWATGRVFDVVGELVSNGGMLYSVATTHTAGASFDATKFTAVAGSGAATGLARTTVKTANYTAAAGDLVPVDATSGSSVITLPNAPADKTMVAVKVITLTAPNTVGVQVNGGGTDTFNRVGGATSMAFSLLAQGANYQYDAATKVWTVSEYAAPLSQLDNRFGHAIYDVRSYGAILDGVADDSTAVQTAIDTCAAAGGGEVVIPAQSLTASKACKINTTLRLKSGVWLRGLGPTSSLTGTANPMIALPASGNVVDRITVSDLFLQSPAGIGISLNASGLSGGYQLGWPRITIENVTVADATTHAFQMSTSSVIETRFINCVSLRAGGHGFQIGATDNFLLGCTAAAGSGATFAGFRIDGANNKVSHCKGYGNAGSGFDLQGSGRHVINGCEAQDNGRYGYNVDSALNNISGSLSDSDKLAGFAVNGIDNVLTGLTAVAGGGGSGQVAPVGVLFGTLATRNVLDGLISNLPSKVGGSLFVSGNTAAPSTRGLNRITYASTITPNPYQGDAVEVLLTGNVTVALPTTYHRGQRLTFVLKQDAVGGRTTTFATGYFSTWTPVTTANATNVITFVNDGAAWLQEAAQVGLAQPASTADDFNRADAATLGSTSVGSIPWVLGFGTAGIVSNQAAPTSSALLATVNTARSDGRVSLKVATVGSTCGILFRYVDNSNYLYFSGSEVSAKIAGATSALATSLGAVANGDVLAVEMSGSSIAAYLNGTLRWAGVFNSLTTATRHGLLGNSTNDRFDDFLMV